MLQLPVVLECISIPPLGRHQNDKPLSQAPVCAAGKGWTQVPPAFGLSRGSGASAVAFPWSHLDFYVFPDTCTEASQKGADEKRTLKQVTNS